MNKLYPKEFKDVSYSRYNVNKNKPRSINEDTKKKIEEIMSEDRELYQLAVSHLDKILATKFEENELERSLKRHHRKCKIRSVLLDPIAVYSRKVADGIRSIKLS